MAGTTGEEQGRDPVDDLGEAWRWGIDASRQMGERLLELYGQVGAAAFDGLARNGGDDLRQVRRDMERWVDLSVELFDRAFTIMRRLGSDERDGNGGAPAASLVGRAGARCSGEIWVHNVSDGDRRTPVLRCPGLASADGSQIPASHVVIESDPGPLRAGASRRVSVLVDVPAGAAGIYHGQILSDASPDSVIPLRLEVRGDGA
jgi:hypothetical protein